MLLLYIFAFIIHGVLAAPPCKNGVELVSTETKNPEDLLGNWTLAYQWFPDIKVIDNHRFECYQLIHFEAITRQLAQVKEAECAKYKIPFNWADAKLILNVPSSKMIATVITIGEKENWMLLDCMSMLRVVFKKVSDDYIAIVDHDTNSEIALMVRELPTLDELNCVINNMDVRKGTSSFELCYTN